MAYTPNQIADTFQSQLGRAPTDFEMKKYATSSIQDLASLKTNFSKLNTGASIADYLTSVGQDPSLQNRLDLYKKYNITPDVSGNYYQSNVALLNALRSGQKPADQTSGSVSGSIVAPSPQPAPASPTATPTPPPEQTPTATPPAQPPIDELGTLKDNYTQAQKSVLGVTKRIDEINKSIDGAMAAKREEIARSGGVVDESQLRSTVLAESAPLLAERKELLSQRTQLVGEQNIAANAYKQATADSFKQKQLDLAQEKVDVQQSQFEQKLEQSGWKSTKINITDAAGNVLGQRVIWTQNPGASGASANKAQYTPTSSGSGGISSKGITNVGNTAQYPKINLGDGAAPEQVLTSLISGPAVPIKGSTTPISQQSLYNAAIDSMLGIPSTTGSRIPAGAAIAVQNKKTDIMNAYGLTEFDVNAAREQMKGMTSANTALLGTAAFTKAYAATAKDFLQLAKDQSALVPRGGAKLLNHYKQWAQGSFTPAGDLAQLETYIYSAAREYAKVTSGGAKSSAALTDSSQAEASKLLNAAQAPETFAKVVQAMQNDMDKVVNNFDKQTGSFPEAVKKLYGMASGADTTLAKGSLEPKVFVEKALVRQGLHYDKLIADMKPGLQAGETLALDNATGKPVYASKEDMASGNYTPL